MRHSAVRPLARAACLALVLALAACGDGATPGGSGNTGKLRVLLTDAPFPYDSVESVNLYVESVAAATSADTTRPDGIQWQTVAEPRRTFDLLDLRAGATAILGEAALPAGQYRAVRLVLDTDRSTVIDKYGRPMQVLWQASAGRVALHALVEDAVDAAAGGSIVIDLDAGRSFVCPGDVCGNTLIFIPWFRAVNTAVTGSLSGTVRTGTSSATATPLADATVSVLRRVGGFSEHVVATSATNAEGRYEVAFLPKGSYRVRVDPPRSAGLAAAERDTVTVVAGQETGGIDFRLQPPSTVGRLIVTSSGPATVTVGDSVFFTAYRTDPGPDSASQNFSVTWSSSDPAVLEVISKGPRRGAAVGVAPGSASITAALPDGRTASALVTVIERRPIAEVSLSLPRATVAVGDSVIAVAAARDAAGQAVPGASFTFTVSDTAVVGLRAVHSGLFFVGYAKKAGTATITARTGDKQASGTVTVQ